MPVESGLLTLPSAARPSRNPLGARGFASLPHSRFALFGKESSFLQ